MSKSSLSSHDFAESSFVDIDAWTDETIQSIRKLRVTSSPAAVRQGVTLSIPIDTLDTSRSADKPEGIRVNAPLRHENDETEARPRELRRRDSLKRREALLKGKEGTRRRQKWEN